MIEFGFECTLMTLLVPNMFFRSMDALKDVIEYNSEYPCKTQLEQEVYVECGKIMTSATAHTFLQRLGKPNVVQRRHFSRTVEARAAQTEARGQGDSETESEMEDDASPAKRGRHHAGASPSSPSTQVQQRSLAATDGNSPAEPSPDRDGAERSTMRSETGLGE